MAAEGHEAVFTWPHPEPNEVIVSGTFNDWGRTEHLTKNPQGYSGKVRVPWDHKTAYKFIVDGVWLTHPDQPTEVDHEGNVNNIYTAPHISTHADGKKKKKKKTKTKKGKKGRGTGAGAEHHDDNQDTESEKSSKESEPDAPALNGHGKLPAAPEAVGNVPASQGTLPQRLADLADTVAAREGTSSALGYVASGFGAAIHSVVGVDPINADQIGIPTPLPTAATVASEYDVSEAPTSALTDAPFSASTDAPFSASTDGAFSPSTDVALSAQVPIPAGAVAVETPAPEQLSVSPAVSMPILALNAPENNDPAPHSPHAEERSTHTSISINGSAPVVGDIGTAAAQAKKEEVAAVKTEASASDKVTDSTTEKVEEPVKVHDEAVVAVVEPSELAPELESKPTSAPVSEPVPAPEPTSTSQPSVLPASVTTEDVEAPKQIETTQAETPEEVHKEVAAPTSTVLPQVNAEVPEPSVGGPKEAEEVGKASVVPEVAPAEKEKVELVPEPITEPIVEPASVPAIAQQVPAVESAAEVVPEAPEATKVEPVPEPVSAPAPVADKVLEPTHASVTDSTPAPESVPLVQPAKKVEPVPTPAPAVNADQPKTNGHTNGHAGEATPVPSTPAKAPAAKGKAKEPFPSSGESPVSSKTGTVSSRKKKLSFFEKVKHFFDHHKEKEKEKEKVKSKK